MVRCGTPFLGGLPTVTVALPDWAVRTGTSPWVAVLFNPTGNPLCQCLSRCDGEGVLADHYSILQAGGFHEHEEAGYR